jgi:hypothetical protein
MAEDINDMVANEPNTPVAEPKGEPQGEPLDEAKLLVKELENLGINNPQELHNMANASSQAGKAWNQVGDLRKQNEMLQMKLDQILSAQQRTQDPYADGDTVDLGKLVENKLEDFWSKKTREQQAAEERYYSEMAKIQSNPKFGSVKDMFDKHVQSPHVNAKLRRGETTLTDEFNSVKDAFYDELLKRAYNTLGGAQKPQNMKPPHVESGETHSPNIPKGDDERQEKLKRTVKARSEGTMSSNDALQKIVNEFLPLDDPLLRI